MPTVEELGEVATEVGCQIYRTAADPKNQLKLEKLKSEVGVGLAFYEAIEFLADEISLLSEDISDLLERPFREPFPTNRRYSDGSFGVLYSALEEDTAATEYTHWAPKFVEPAPDRVIQLRLFIVSFRLDGRVADVRLKAGVWPWLTADDYRDCQGLGRLAYGNSFEGLLAPSARANGGSTAPVFSRPAVSGGQVASRITVWVNPDGTSSYELVPA